MRIRRLEGPMAIRWSTHPLPCEAGEGQGGGSGFPLPHDSRERVGVRAPLADRTNRWALRRKTSKSGTLTSILSRGPCGRGSRKRFAP
jgi:hypothetical protein